MPRAIIINDSEKSMIIDLINQKKSATEIVSMLNEKYSYGKIMSFATDINMKDQLSENNRDYKSNRLKYHNVIRRTERMKYIETAFGDMIRKMVLNGKILKDIINETGLTQNPLTDFLKYTKLNDIRMANSKKVIGDKARINGKNNGLRGIERKPLTDDIIEYFNKLKDDGIYRNEVAKKISEKYGYGPLKYSQLCKIYGHPKRRPITGKYGSMYGKSPPLGSGIGISGWILYNSDKYFFRSSLELRVFLYLIENNINFKLSRHHIPYVGADGNNKTYNPDIVIGNVIYEIKPSTMLKLRAVRMKQKAAEQYCNKFALKYQFITENTFDLNIITFDKIDSMINEGFIVLTENKLKDNYKRLIKAFNE